MKKSERKKSYMHSIHVRFFLNVIINYFAEYFELSNANIQMKSGFKNNNPNPNRPDFPKFFATLKKETIKAIKNAGGNSKDSTHHHDMLAILNRKKML